jgi:large conductance mechanosensitive channel
VVDEMKRRLEVLKEFRAFILRGSVVDLAVGVVIGAAFGTIVTSLVKDIITPLLGLLHVPDFGDLTRKVGTAEIRYGAFLNALISFLATGAAVFFLVVKPVNRLTGLVKTEEAPKMRECPHCLSSIPMAASVCAHCARELKRRRSRSARRTSDG